MAHPNCDQSSAGEQREDKMDAEEEGENKMHDMIATERYKRMDLPQRCLK